MRTAALYSSLLKSMQQLRINRSKLSFLEYITLWCVRFSLRSAHIIDYGVPSLVFRFRFDEMPGIVQLKEYTEIFLPVWIQLL